MNFIKRRGLMDADRLEEEIRQTIPVARMVPRDLDLPAVEYCAPEETEVIERPSAETLGRITAQAIMVAHQSAIEALENLGKAEIERVGKIEMLKAESLKHLEEIKELCEQFREAGKLMSLKVEAAGNDLSETQNLIDAMKRKIQQE